MPNNLLQSVSDILFAAWIVLVAASFFGPYLEMPVPAEVTARGYAVLLVVSLVTLALRLVRRETPATVAKVQGKGSTS